VSASVESSRFAIATNGYADSPAQALRDYFLMRRVKQLVMISHPLVPQDGQLHRIQEWRQGELVGDRRVDLPSHPPYTYPLDLLAPLLPPRVDCWIGFNALACWRGILARRMGMAQRIGYWCVDYVDNRFGRGILTMAFETIDRTCCRLADARFELSEAALAARSARHRSAKLGPALVIPMGAWFERTPKISSDAHLQRRVIYMGHLVPRQGVGMLLEALAVLHGRGRDVTTDIIGRGPLEAELKERARELGIHDSVTFHGFVADHRQIEAILATGSVAVAPYDTKVDSFTRFADPGKLKAYLAAGLPIVVTDVPPNARDLEVSGAAELVEFTPEALANGIDKMLSSPQTWKSRHLASLRVGADYDWTVLLSQAMEALGFGSDH
jgi:glycosyltransferase involved in cell wall biosynthesis